MVFSHIHSSNDKSEIGKLNSHIKKGKPTFVLIFMEGCGPCNMTRPEWGKLKNVLPKYQKDDNVMIADVDQTVLDELTSIKEKPMGFPTMLYIEGNQLENYEGGRTITDFVKWIEGKKKKKMEQKGGKSRNIRKTKKTKKTNKSRNPRNLRPLHIQNAHFVGAYELQRQQLPRTLNVRKCKKKHKNTRKMGKKTGGLSDSSNSATDSKLNKFHITNTEIILFLINFLEKSELKTILVKHYQFIDSIETQNFTFKENPEFRSFVNDTVQWFLLDYNKDFLNSVLEIVKNTIENPVFLNKSVDWDRRYNVLLENVVRMIERYNNSENIDIFILLEIILRGLRMPKVKEMIIKNIMQQEDKIINFKTTIVCLLNWLIRQDLIRDTEIRNLLKKMIEDLSYNDISSIWVTLKKLLGLVKNCSGSIGADLSSIAAKKVYDSTSNAAKNIYGSTLGKLF